MDWDHLFSISPDELSEEEKDELYNMVTWFNIDSEKLSEKKSLLLLRISQELLKYKGEQVEILLHKLDEVATQHGEEDVKKIDSDADAKSVRSRKSSSIEFENLEYKYLQLKEKYKKITKVNDKNLSEISKLKKKIVSLEEENNRLEREMEVLNQDDNQSDISETIKEQHKELVNTLHNKNKHISQLLSDIEQIEKENSVLREKLTTVRDDLSTATKELNNISENFKEAKIQLHESSEIIVKLTAENESLQDEIRESNEEKLRFEQEMQEFTEEVNRRVDEWKKILHERDRIIEELKSKKNVDVHTIQSSSSSINQEQDDIHISALNKVLLERENQLLNLKSKLQQAVAEMEETTNTIKELTEEKESLQLKLDSSLENIVELKKQLKSSHERCQNLQEDLAFVEETVTIKTSDLNNLINKIKQEGNGDIADYLDQIQNLKGQIRSQERQIMDLVKAANKLQSSCDRYEEENEALRDQLGLKIDDEVNVSNVKSKYRIYKKELMTLKKQIQKLEKQNLELRSIIHEKNRTINKIQEQQQQHQQQDDVDEESQVSKSEMEDDVLKLDNETQTECKNLAEENEALRKGLHEILESVQTKKESSVKEVRSETLEQLLRALDAKHISGWYHPAMRLQAELHNQEGINAELREQLRLTRLELKEIKDSVEREDSARMKSQSEEDTVDSALDKSISDIKKTPFIDEEMKKLLLQIDELKINLDEVAKNATKKISDLSIQNKSLTNIIDILNNKLETAITPIKHEELQSNFDNLTMKYRSLLDDFNNVINNKKIELEILEKSNKILEQEKIELRQKLGDAYEKLHCVNYQNVDSKIEELSRKLSQCEVNELNERQRADHINNLYELVKDQLRISEEKCKQFENAKIELSQKYFELQKKFNDFENKLCNYIDTEYYKNLDRKYNEILLEYEKFKTVSSINKADSEKEPISDQYIKWRMEKVEELLKLKHEIVDLQSISDDKGHIVKLRNEIDKLRQQNEKLDQNNNRLTDDLQQIQQEKDELSRKLENRNAEINDNERQLKCEIEILKELLEYEKFQYSGSIPLGSQEKYIHNIKKAVQDKHEAFLTLNNARNVNKESLILKEHYENELKNIEKIIKTNSIEMKDVLLNLQDRRQIQFNELQFRRQLELKDTQLQHVFDRVKIQDEQIIKLEEELFSLHRNFSGSINWMPLPPDHNNIVPHSPTPSPPPPPPTTTTTTTLIVEDHTEEILSLKSSIKSLEEIIREKDKDILHYQSLLKEDRDKHCLAASLMREELKLLQQCLTEEKQKCVELKKSVSEIHPNKAALEQYFMQVHCIEDELSQLRTRVPSLESQLQATREEAVRWRTIANDRLESMQKLGNDLEEIHRNEILAYKKDSEKWRDEVLKLKELIVQYRNNLCFDQVNDMNITKAIREKDNKIHELTVNLRQVKSEMKKPGKYDPEISEKLAELEMSKEQLSKELQTIKKRFDQLLNRERSAREEIRELRAKLVKRSTSSLSSDRTDKSIKEQLQKKINTLENEIIELKDNLSKQIAINEAHRIKVADDFEKWNKQKFWQQKAEKLKEKLKQKENDIEKLQQTCEGYRTLIERLEREKYNIENRLRNLKTNTSSSLIHEMECLRIENMKLISENEALNEKLTMQQHQSGALGAAILQEKLEAQERKLAIFEISSKSSLEVRSELERLQNTVSALQKTNLSLEAENLDLKFDLEKMKKEAPNLREQVAHLENYIKVLKNENIERDNAEVLNDSVKLKTSKVSELERTILVLKRVVEKLQVENKRLVSGKRSRPERCSSAEQLRSDYERLKEQYCQSLQKIAQLEADLKVMKSTENTDISSRSEELDKVKEQLEQKTKLLDQVRILLHRAAIKEKALLEEISKLKGEPTRDTDRMKEI